MNPEDWKGGNDTPYNPPVYNGGPAFPVNTEASPNPGAYCADPGMTLRDYFAAKAMQGLLACAENDFRGRESVAAANAYAMADAMLAARGQS